MIHRTYFVVMPTWTHDQAGIHTGVAAELSLDILVEGVFSDTGMFLGQGGPVNGRPGSGYLGLRPVLNMTPAVPDSAELLAWLTNLGWPFALPLPIIPAPAMWRGHPQGCYWELRSRVLPIRPSHFNTAQTSGFLSRTQLGWHVSVYPWVPFDLGVGRDCGVYNPAMPFPGHSRPVPDVQLSWSLIAGGLNAHVADPGYGSPAGGDPVIRLVNSLDVCSTVGAGLQASTYIVHLDTNEAKDEDRDPNGGTR